MIEIEGKQSSGWCGGVIIDEKNILTAAHCQRNKKTFIKHDNIIVIAGEHNIKKSDGETKHEVCGWTAHPDFSGKEKIHRAGPDIAILHLCEPLTFRKGKFDILLSIV